MPFQYFFFIQFQQMSDECYDKAFILNIIDSSHLPWKGLLHWSGRWDRCFISVFRLPEMSSTMWSHRFKDTRRCDHRHRGMRSASGKLFSLRSFWDKIEMHIKDVVKINICRVVIQIECCKLLPVYEWITSQWVSSPLVCPREILEAKRLMPTKPCQV